MNEETRKVLAASEMEIMAGMRGLCEAVGNLARVRDRLRNSMNLDTANDEIRMIVVNMIRACNHLTDASADIPNELWLLMLEVGKVGGEEVKRVLNETCGRAA